MLQGKAATFHRTKSVMTLAGIITLVVPTQTLLGMWAGVDLEITHSNNLTALDADAYASRTGGYHLTLADPPAIHQDASASQTDDGIWHAKATVGTTFFSEPFGITTSSTFFPGHSGTTPPYYLPPAITAEISVANNGNNGIVSMNSESFFDNVRLESEQANYDYSRFVAGFSYATASISAPSNTTVQSIVVSTPVYYVMGLAVYDPEDPYYSNATYPGWDSYFIADPATTMYLSIGGQQVSGGYILNEAGDISTYGDLAYDSQTGAFSFDVSSLIDLDVSGNSTVALVSSARLPGDFNSDEVVDATDIDLLYGQIASSYSPAGVFDIYDLNIDGVVDAGADSDVEVLVETVLMTVLGDANLDRFVGTADLNIVLGNWNQSGVGFAGGDLDGDNFVGINDLNLVLNNWNWGTPPSIDAAIPEPATLMLLGIGLVAIGHRNH